MVRKSLDYHHIPRREPPPFDNDLIVITPDGRMGTKQSNLRSLMNQISKQKLTNTKLFMNEQDYQDIVKWSKEQ